MDRPATVPARGGWVQTPNVRAIGCALGGLALLAVVATVARMAGLRGTPIPPLELALLAVLLLPSLVLAWRLVFGGVRIEQAGLTIRNPLNTHAISWEAVNRCRPITAHDWELGRPGAVIIELKSGRTITVGSVGRAGVDTVYGDSGTRGLIDEVNESRRTYAGISA
jgi:hypothetical protein